MKQSIQTRIKPLLWGGVLSLASLSVSAHNASYYGFCEMFPKEAFNSGLKQLLINAQQQENGGFGFDMWATVVDRDGKVCAVAHTGKDRGDQWPGSRVISAQKANTANAFSLPGFALSTANLHEATQNGGSLYGLQHSNPVDVAVAYGGDAALFGTANDPMIGKKIGGINVFGGGLALYMNDKGHRKLVGAIGVSGDSSCADHNIAWRIRHQAGMDYVPAGPNFVSGTGNNKVTNDQLIYKDDNVDTGGFGHPDCGHGEKDVTEALPLTRLLNSTH